MENQIDIIPVSFEDGTVLQVEVTMLGGMEPVAAKECGVSFENVTNSIRSITGEIAKVIKDIQPNKATVTLGFDVATCEGQLTALLVKGTASASLTVTLEWLKETSKEKTANTKLSQKR